MGLQGDYDITVFIPVYIVCSIGVVANFMLLVAFIKDPLKCFRNSATYLVGNLALSDLGYNIMFMATISVGNSRNGIVEFLQYLSFYSSVLTIFSISLDRCLMIVYPFKHRFLMSGKIMALWIAFIWLLSSIHPMQRLFDSKDAVDVIKPGVGTTLISLTTIAYGKTYFALKKQAKSMLGKRAPYTSHNDQSTSNEDKEDSRSTTESLRTSCSFETQNSLVKIEHQRSENFNVCASYTGEPDRSLNERAQNMDSLDVSGEDHVKRLATKKKRAQVINDRAQKGSEHVQNDSGKNSKNSRVVNNANEQKFLNTVLIVACVAVLTVAPGTVYGQISQKVKAKNPELHYVLQPLLYTIYSLNFAVNPFIYYLRLKRYKKTFEIVYRCKC